MRKFNKRPVNEQEAAFEMGVRVCYCACTTCNQGPCPCPEYPTHQIQYDQSTENMTIAYPRDPNKESVRG